MVWPLPRHGAGIRAQCAPVGADDAPGQDRCRSGARARAAIRRAEYPYHRTGISWARTRSCRRQPLRSGSRELGSAPPGPYVVPNGSTERDVHVAYAIKGIHLLADRKDALVSPELANEAAFLNSSKGFSSLLARSR